MKWMEIDYDYLRTGTAIGFRASRELCSNYLYKKLMQRNTVFVFYITKFYDY